MDIMNRENGEDTIEVVATLGFARLPMFVDHNELLGS
jgi:hypothetical protein